MVRSAPNASATAASAGTDLNARAAQYAARNVRDNLAAFVAGLDGCGAGAVRFKHGEVFSPSTTRSFDGFFDKRNSELLIVFDVE